MLSACQELNGADQDYWSANKSKPVLDSEKLVTPETCSPFLNSGAEFSLVVKMNHKKLSVKYIISLVFQIGRGFILGFYIGFWKVPRTLMIYSRTCKKRVFIALKSFCNCGRYLEIRLLHGHSWPTYQGSYQNFLRVKKDSHSFHYLSKKKI